MLLASCQDQDDAVYPQDYLSDEGIEVNIRGQAGTNTLDEQYIMRLYETYNSQSVLYSRNNLIEIRRFSEDFQSAIDFTIVLDETYHFSDADCSYRLTKVKGNKLIIVDHYATTPQIDQLNYDQDTGHLTFDYELTIDNERDQHYTVEGKADVIVYQY